MAGRSPARFLAPLALVACALALFLVVTASPDEERPAASGSAVREAARGASSATPSGQQPARRRKVRKRYTVKPGDTPSGIAEKTGVPLGVILSLNPELDPQTLAPGTKIRLRR
jgi:LysM repeat protein